jgi:PIN domain nuclease of toxin-antitoxin system
LKLLYLHDIGRLTKKPDALIDALANDIGLRIHDHSLASIIDAAFGLSWTHDLFDRLIVAQAKVDDTHLITSDRTILEHYKKAIW